MAKSPDFELSSEQMGHQTTRRLRTRRNVSATVGSLSSLGGIAGLANVALKGEAILSPIGKFSLGSLVVGIIGLGVAGISHVQRRELKKSSVVSPN